MFDFIIYYSDRRQMICTDAADCSRLPPAETSAGKGRTRQRSREDLCFTVRLARDEAAVVAGVSGLSPRTDRRPRTLGERKAKFLVVGRVDGRKGKNQTKYVESRGQRENGRGPGSL